MALTVHRRPEGILDWLLAMGRDLPGQTEFRRVGQRLPAGYDAYIRLFQPFVIWASEAAAEAGAGDHERRTWRSLAAQAGVRYHAAMRASELDSVFPADRSRLDIGEGYLEPVTRRRLFEHLRRLTPAQPAFFYYHLGAILALGDPVLVEATVEEAEDVVAWAASHPYTAFETPDAVWPMDKAWFVHTDHDSTSTYVAGSRALVDTLLEDSQLEVLEVDRHTRLDDEW